MYNTLDIAELRVYLFMRAIPQYNMKEGFLLIWNSKSETLPKLVRKFKIGIYLIMDVILKNGPRYTHILFQ